MLLFLFPSLRSPLQLSVLLSNSFVLSSDEFSLCFVSFGLYFFYYVLWTQFNYCNNKILFRNYWNFLFQNYIKKFLQVWHKAYNILDLSLFVLKAFCNCFYFPPNQKQPISEGSPYPNFGDKRPDVLEKKKERHRSNSGHYTEAWQVLKQLEITKETLEHNLEQVVRSRRDMHIFNVLMAATNEW